MAGKLHKVQITSPASSWPVPMSHSCIFWLSLSAHGAVKSSVVLYGVSPCLETQDRWCDADFKDLCFISCRQNGKEITHHAAFWEENPVRTSFKLIIWHNILILLPLLQFFQGNDFVCVSI